VRCLRCCDGLRHKRSAVSWPHGRCGSAVACHLEPLLQLDQQQGVVSPARALSCDSEMSGPGALLLLSLLLLLQLSLLLLLLLLSLLLLLLSLLLLLLSLLLLLLLSLLLLLLLLLTPAVLCRGQLVPPRLLTLTQPPLPAPLCLTQRLISRPLDPCRQPQTAGWHRGRQRPSRLYCQHHGQASHSIPQLTLPTCTHKMSLSAGLLLMK